MRYAKKAGTENMYENPPGKGILIGLMRRQTLYSGDLFLFFCISIFLYFYISVFLYSYLLIHVFVSVVDKLIRLVVPAVKLSDLSTDLL